jgi:autotransporter-associated beta strand protein
MPPPNQLTVVTEEAKKSENMKTIQVFLCLLLTTTLPRFASAYIAGPYTADPFTLHLWHLDEAAVPCIDAVSSAPLNLSGLVNGAQLTNSAYPGFGTSLNTLGTYGYSAWTSNSAGASSFAGAGLFSNATTSAAIPMSYMGANGAFTMEALLCPQFPVATNFGTVANGGTGRGVINWQLITGESGTASNRLWQFRFDPIGVITSGIFPSTGNTSPLLDFINVGGGGTTYELWALIPTNGPNAIVSNQWYHVAVTYNGVPNTASNFMFYWTAMNLTNTSANLILATNLPASLAGNNKAKPAFAIGNTGRNDAGNWLGLIDEVRMSSVARGPSGMMFALPSVSLTPIPGQFVAAGSTVTLTSVGSGGTPIQYQWLFNNTNITAATASNISGFTNSTLVISNITLAQAGAYTLIATNANSAATNSAMITVGLPVPGLANTGVGANDTLLAGGAVDPNWQLVISPDPTYTGPNAYVDSTLPSTSYLAEGPNSQWIAPGNDVNAAGGLYEYQTTFILDSQNLTNMQLTVNWAADNACFDILLNGVDLAITDNNGFTSLFPTVITNNLVAGSNVLVCVVSNAPGSGPNPTAFRAELSGLSAVQPPTPVALLSAPANATNYQFQSASFVVTAYGSGPLSYQWFFGTNLLASQTNRTLSLANLDPSQAGSYTVVITNSVSSTNATATLTVITPDTLEWQGLTADWDASTANWFDLNSQTLVAFSQNDGVLFDDNSTNQNFSVNLDLPLTPNSLVVNATNNFTFTGGGYLTGNFNLLKNGSGTLILDTLNTCSGMTLIQGGVLQVGNNDSSGSLGSSFVSNNATLVFSRGDTALNISSPIHGSGAVDYAGSGAVTVSAASDYSGGTAISQGIVNLQNAAGLGAASGPVDVASGQLYVTANGNVPQALTLNGVGDGNGALRKGGSSVTTNFGPITLASDSTIGVDSGSTLNLTNLVSGGTSALTVSGSGTLVLSGVSNSWTGGTTIDAGSTLQIGDGGPDGSLGAGQVTDDGTLTLLSANNILWTNPVIDAGTFNQSGPGRTTLSGGPLTGFSGAVRTTGNAQLQLAPGEALTNQLSLTIGTAQADTNCLQLTGGNLVSDPITIFPRAFITTLGSGQPTVNYPNIVNLGGTNLVNPPSQINIPSGGNLFTLESDNGYLIFSNGVNGAGSGRFLALQGPGSGEVDGPITQSAGESINVYKLGQGTWTLNGSSSYTGPTVVSNGTLVVNGSIAASPATAAGGTLGGIGTFTGPVVVNPGATLAPTLATGPGSPIGILTIDNSLTLLPGSITAMQLNPAAGTNDLITGLTNVSYGGTLVVTNVAGTLTAGNSFQLFSATAFTNNFSAVTGVLPSGLGLSFDPSRGVLSVTSINTNPTNIIAAVTGGNLSLSWPADHTGWRLLIQTNHLAGGLSANTNDWTTVPGSASTNQVNITIDPTKPGEYYRMVYP